MASAEYQRYFSRPEFVYDVRQIRSRPDTGSGRDLDPDQLDESYCMVTINSFLPTEQCNLSPFPDNGIRLHR
jgi:hypothetical protein